MTTQGFTPAEFEKEVVELLEFCGWTVSPERLVGHKKVDVYGERRDFYGKLRRAAVECRSGRRPMARKAVSEVYADYLPLVEARSIDEVLLVTRGPLAPSGYTYVEGSSSLRHMSYSALVNSLMDFSNYVNALRSDYDRRGLPGIYVPQLSDWGGR